MESFNLIVSVGIFGAFLASLVWSSQNYCGSLVMETSRAFMNK